MSKLKRSDLPNNLRWIARAIFTFSLVDIILFLAGGYYLWQWFNHFGDWNIFFVFIFLLGSSILGLFMLKGAEQQFDKLIIKFELELQEIKGLENIE